MENIQSKAQRIIQKHKVDYVYVCSDGNVFLPDKKNAAEFHAVQNKLKVTKIEKIDEQKIKNDNLNQPIEKNNFENTEIKEVETQPKSNQVKNNKKRK